MDKITLLIVEDDKKALNELLRILNKHTDFDIYPAENPSSAIEVSKSIRINIALLDLKLPEMSGLDLIPILRESNPDMLFTVMTGYGEEETPIVAKEYGVVDFLEKPLNLKYLLASLKFQEREAKIRQNLRDTSKILNDFFNLVEDGIIIKKGDEILVANKKGEDLYQKFKDCNDLLFVFNGREYERNFSKKGDISFYHFKDITSAKEISLSKSVANLSRLLSHELHNSLTPLKLYLQEIGNIREDDEEFKETVLKLVKEGLYQIERLSKLTKRFKELSSNKPLLLKEVNLKKVIEDVKRTLQPLIKEKGIILSNDIPEVLVFASEEELFQSLFNLILNSVEAVKQNGRIDLNAHKVNDDVILKIVDNGGGLPQELKEDPFIGYLTTKESGTGLGLILARDLIQKMGGSLQIIDKNSIGVEVIVKLKKAY